MKIVATNIFDFNTWYRFNIKTVSKDMIIDLSSDKIFSTKLFQKIGFFEEDGDVFFVEIPESLDSFASEEQYLIPINKIISIIPLNDRGATLLVGKMPDFKISSPIPTKLSRLIIKERNDYLTKKGGEMLIASFGKEFSIELDNYTHSFLKAMNAYNDNHNSEPDNLFERIVLYERSRPYPNNDSGFLFDVGSIAKAHFRLTDDDLKNKVQLKEINPVKYELIEEVLSLSLFLQKNGERGVFNPLKKEFEKSDWLKKLNKELSLINSDEYINNILILAFYLKFRELTRNTSNLLDRYFYDEICKFLSNAEKEATVALYLTGMFFGSVKFRELYFKYNPLPISKLNSPKIEHKIKKENDPITLESKINQEYKVDASASKNNSQQQNKESAKTLDIFNNMSFYRLLIDSLPPNTTPAHKKVIQKVLDNLISNDSIKAEDKLNILINNLNTQMNETTAKKAPSKRAVIEFIISFTSSQIKKSPNYNQLFMIFDP
ncbi:hypothetical protein EZS27_020506 [termite gut metagenome]|uniref:Uncharacterized protein n=1 Tax=termite gut metagenome TaxID=433724 RepID=A0A5J4RD83_9ZZZZ